MLNKPLKNILIVLSIIAGYIIVGLAILFIMLGIPKYNLTSFLKGFNVYLLELIFILLVISIVFNFTYIKDLCHDIGNKYIILLLILTFAGILVTSFVAPRVHRIYYDEDIYNNIGQSIAQEHTAVMCNEAYYENNELRIISGEYYKQPPGYTYLIGAIYRLFGINELYTFILNNVLFGLTLILIFFITFLLFKDRFASLLASLSFFIIPINLHWFNTCALEPSTAFFLCLPVFCLLLYIRTKKPVGLFFLVCSLAFSFYFRVESLLIFFIILLFLFLKDIKTFIKKDIYIFGILLLALSAGIIIHLFAVQDQNWGAAGAKFSLEYFLPNLKTNSIFYISNKSFPILITLFGIAGLGFYKNKAFLKEKIVLFIWFLIFWGIFLFFYAGSYEYGQDVRFSILSFPPLAVFAGLGISFVCTIVKDKIKFIKPIVVLLLLFHFTWFLPFIRSEGEEAWEARWDHKYAVEFASLMQDNSIVYTHNPSIFLLRKRSAVQTSASMQQGKIEQHLSQFRGGVYVHFNYWSNVGDPSQRGFTDFILNNYRYQVIKEYHYRNFKYGLYKVLGKKEQEE